MICLCCRNQNSLPVEIIFVIYISHQKSIICFLNVFPQSLHNIRSITLHCYVWECVSWLFVVRTGSSLIKTSWHILLRHHTTVYSPLHDPILVWTYSCTLIVSTYVFKYSYIFIHICIKEYQGSWCICGGGKCFVPIDIFISYWYTEL